MKYNLMGKRTEKKIDAYLLVPMAVSKEKSEFRFKLVILILTFFV